MYGNKDKDTIKLQDMLRKLAESNDTQRYEQLDELLAQREYIVSENSAGILMVRRPKGINGLSKREVRELMAGAIISSFMKESEDE